MITNRSLGDQVWVDLNSPTKEEVDSLVLTQNISPIIAKDLLSPTPTQFGREDGQIVYAVLHVPAFKHSHAAGNSQEIDFIISAGSVVTTRYDSIDALHYFAKRMEVSEALNKDERVHLFFGIMAEIYKGMADELSFIEDWMREIEENIFEGQEKAMVFAISNAGRNLLNFRRTIDPHNHVFEFLQETGKAKFGEAFGAEVKILMEEWRRMMKRVNNQMDLLIELRETNNATLTTKQNEIMKNLAVIGSALLPLTIVGQIFGLSIRSFPLMNHPDAFWIILGFMAMIVLASVIYARVKKWM